MRILYIVPYVPNLIRVRPYQLIRNLARRGHRVTLATLWENDGERDSLARLGNDVERVIAVPQSRWRSFINCALAIPTSTPLQATYCWNPRLNRELLGLTRDHRESSGWDVIHVEHLRGAQYGLAMLGGLETDRQEGRPRPPVIWDSVDSISSLFRQTSQQSKRQFNRWMAKMELQRTEAYERRAAGQFDRVLVASTADQKAYWALGREEDAHHKISVLANGVDLDYFQPDPQKQRDAAALVVHGKISYHANVSMILHLVRDILPIVWQRQPGVKLWIVGKDPPREISKLAENPAITVTGTVSDIRPYLQGAAVAVSPVVYGAGIQNKVLEAMACGAPVISTSLAISALAVRAGQDVLVADDANAFASAIVDLLNDPARQRSLSQAGRRYVEQHHDWGEIAARLETIYLETIERRQRSAANQT